MSRTKKFKMTDLGPIPEDWEVRSMGSHSSIARGGSPRPIDAYLTTSGSGVNWIKIGDSSVGGKYIYRTAERIISEGVARSRVVHSGDLLLSNSMSFGRPYILKIDGCIHDGWLVIQDYKEVFDTEYLYYALGIPLTTSQYRSLAAGSGVQNLNKELVAKVSIIGPKDVGEQRRIAAALSDADELIAALTELLEKKRNLKQGAMQQLLTGKRRLPGFKGKWVEKPFDACFELMGNNTYSRDCMCDSNEGVANIHYGDVLIRYGAVADFSRVEVPSLRNDVLRRGDLLQDGDVIFADTAEDETVGKVVEIQGLRGRCAVAGLHTIACRPKSLFAPGWLGYYLNSTSFHNQLLPLISGTKVESVSKTGLRTTKLNCPSKVAEQLAIAEVLTDMDEEIAGIEAELEKAKNVKTGMMQQLLTGKVRLEVA